MWRYAKGSKRKIFICWRYNSISMCMKFGVSIKPAEYLQIYFIKQICLFCVENVSEKSENRLKKHIYHERNESNRRQNAIHT